MKKKLVEAVQARLSQVDPITADAYEDCFHQPWDLYFHTETVCYLSSSHFRTHEGYFLKKLSYTKMSIDELLDIYLVLIKLEKYHKAFREEAFWRELGLKKIRYQRQLRLTAPNPHYQNDKTDTDEVPEYIL
jgi:hypothetical protein